MHSFISLDSRCRNPNFTSDKSKKYKLFHVLYVFANFEIFKFMRLCPSDL